MDSVLAPRGESVHPVKTGSLSVPILVDCPSARLWLDAEGSVTMLESVGERRALFGRQSLNLYKIQAGVTVPSGRVAWLASASGDSVTFEGRAFESVAVTQEYEAVSGASAGFLRRVKLRNEGAAPIRLRLITVDDPTGAHSLRPGRAGAIGVNAFGREGHVAMDEISDPACARVVGCRPSTSMIHMTVDPRRSGELVRRGELPGPTAGMTGQVLILQQADLELLPAEARELAFACLYDPLKLEDALKRFDSVLARPTRTAPAPPWAVTSDGRLNYALAAAVSCLSRLPSAWEGLDSAEELLSLYFVRPEAAYALVSAAKPATNKDGSLPHTSEPGRPGLLETAVFLKSASSVALYRGDRKYLRSVLPVLRRAARFLAEATKGGALDCGREAPQGWRRRIGRGFPTGAVPEVTFAAAAALRSFSDLSAAAGRREEAAAYLQASRLIIEDARRRLIDGDGSLVLNVDMGGTAHREVTVDQAVALYRLGSGEPPAASYARRLSESDFETGYGPRTVPTTNKAYFNGSYCEGQLGGYWPRAALASVVASYEAGCPGLGSLTLSNVAKLVAEDLPAFGALPGTLPLWLDVEAKKAHGAGWDPVAASRMVEAVLLGELGVGWEGGRTRASPREPSAIGWLGLGGVLPAEESAVFVGRCNRGVTVFGSGAKLEFEGTRLKAHEWLRPSRDGVYALLFYGGGQVLCLGSGLEEVVHCKVGYKPREPDLLRNLTAKVEELDQETGDWRDAGRVRVGPDMSVEARLAPGAWTAFRFSTA